MDGGQVAVLQRDEIFPAIVLTPGESRTAGIQSIQEQTDRQPWKALFQARRETIESSEFAILLGGVAPGFSMNSVISEKAKPVAVTSLASKTG